MPLLILLILALMLRAAATDGFKPAMSFVFSAHGDRLTSAAVLEPWGTASLP